MTKRKIRKLKRKAFGFALRTCAAGAVVLLAVNDLKKLKSVRKEAEA